jgi:sulfatase maturation enzyme AslB (radical SAM superfamily)
MKPEDTMCSAFWKHTNIRSGNNIFPCCRFKYPVAKFDGDVDKILHLPVYEKLRHDSANGIPIKGCSKCYQEDAQGKAILPNEVKAGASTRQEFNEHYTADSVQLEYLEAGFDNICNLMCVMCSGVYSNKWANIENPDISPKLNIKDTDEFVNIPDTITHVEFLGGEPLMTNRHKTFLQKLKDRSKVTVVYNTNGTFLLDATTILLLKECKEVFFYVSIDAYGKLNDKVREGSNWEDIEKFITQLNELDFKFQIHSVLHSENWKGFNELEQWINDNNFNWRIMACTYPTELDPVNLKQDDKSLLIDMIKSSNIPNKDYFIEHLTSQSI